MAYPHRGIVGVFAVKQFDGLIDGNTHNSVDGRHDNVSITLIDVGKVLDDALNLHFQALKG
jgi:hypothetical protein